VSPSGGKPGAQTQAPNAIELSENSHVFATVEMAGTPATAMLDTGADAAFFSPRWLDQHLPDRPRLHLPLPKIGIGQRVGTVGNMTSVDLRFAGRHIKHLGGPEIPELDDVMPDYLGRRIDVVIGMTLFREMRSWTVDFPRKTMWVDWLGSD
jgi:hypothetical protein